MVVPEHGDVLQPSGRCYGHRVADPERKQYYLDASGAMVEGWAKIGEDYYYFHPGSGEKAYSTTIGVFELDASGKWIH